MLVRLLEDSLRRSSASLMVAKEVVGAVLEDRATGHKDKEIATIPVLSVNWMPWVQNCPLARHPLKMELML